MKKNDRGVALLIAIFSVALLTFLAVEIGYNAVVEFRIGNSQLDRLKAYYLAKTGVEMSRLKVHIFKKVVKKYGEQLGSNKTALDIIWQFPFNWPVMIPDIAGVDKKALDKINQESLISGQINAITESEGSKIDINDLGSPSEELRKGVNSQILLMLQNRSEQDDEIGRRLRDLRLQEIVNNIADWVDEDSVSLNGGDERSGYGNTKPPFYPPNRSMKTIDELHMVKDVSDEIYDILAPNLTVYGIKGVNINTAQEEVLRSITGMTKDMTAELLKRRKDPKLGGPFTNLEDLTTYLRPFGLSPETFNKNPAVPLLFDAEYNFRVKSAGIFRNARRDIIAVLYDFDKVKGQLSSFLKGSPGTSPTAGATATPGASPGASAQANPTATPGESGSQDENAPPEIVFWQEY